MPITSELLILAKNACKSYKAYLEEEKKMRLQQEKQDAEEKRVAEGKLIEMQKIEQNLKNIKNLKAI